MTSSFARGSAQVPLQYYACDLGRALVDRELDLPESWAGDRDRARAAGIPDEVGFATTPRLGMALLDRAITAGAPLSWVTADEAYRPVTYLRGWREQHDAADVLATKRNDTLITAGGEVRADALVAGLQPRAWRRRSVGAGAHGPRDDAWARVPIRIGWAPGHWLLARRSISDPTEIAYDVCDGPRRATLLDLAWTAGSRGRIEECFAQANNDAGLDHYHVRSWRAW